MFSRSLMILANLAPPAPSYRVEMSPHQESWYEFAAPVSVALAIILAGLWLLRSRTARTGNGRALLLASAGCLGMSYTAWWVWNNRGVGIVGPNTVDAMLANNMPLLWLGLCMIVVLITPAQRRWRRAAEREDNKGYCTEGSLALGMIIAAIITVWMAPGRIDMWPALLFGFWILAFSIYCINAVIRRLLAAQQNRN